MCDNTKVIKDLFKSFLQLFRKKNSHKSKITGCMTQRIAASDWNAIKT